MKSVMISIQPKWCGLIANRKKTVEVRKTKPELETPFKCYIYCTKSKKEFLQSHSNIKFYCEDRDFIGGHGVGWYRRLNGSVIGEFVCSDITWGNGLNFVVKEDAETTLQGTCLTKDDIYKYIGLERGMSRSDKKTEFYRWHISDLVIYDKPKELSEFGLERPPQSWCYVNEENNEEPKK